MIKNLNDCDLSKCTGCYACVPLCTKKCITMNENDEGFLYPYINTNECINCGLCVKVCPVLNHTSNTDKLPTNAYAAISKDSNIRSNSSSGGVFSVLAEYVLEQGGIVFGASFNDKMEVNHIYIENKNDLFKLRGSKYVQSKIGNTFNCAKEFLDSGRLVLFTGTPCQIAGLKSFLKKTYDNLICQDIICHGVPSPMVWKLYLQHHKNKALGDIKNICFRNKQYGWKRFSILYEYKNGKKYSVMFSKDPYMRGFLANLFLRMSCYSCCFKGDNRFSDITLADFWGIQNVLPEFDDDKGTSLLILNTDKGKEILNKISDELLLKEVNPTEALKYNSAAVRSVVLPTARKDFINELKTNSFYTLINKYCGFYSINRLKSIFNRLKNKVCVMIRIYKKK